MKQQFPLSDHYDGRHFFNPGPNRPARGLLQVLRWQLRGERAAWPVRVLDPEYPPPPDTVGPNNAAVTFINHASFLIRLPGVVVLTDPIFSERCLPVSWVGPRRVRAPGVTLTDLPKPDVVLLSHNHYDHMDLPTLRVIQARYAPRFITTLGNGRGLAKLGIVATELDWWQDVTVGGLQHAQWPPNRRTRVTSGRTGGNSMRS